MSNYLHPLFKRTKWTESLLYCTSQDKILLVYESSKFTTSFLSNCASHWSLAALATLLGPDRSNYTSTCCKTRWFSVRLWGLCGESQCRFRLCPLSLRTLSQTTGGLGRFRKSGTPLRLWCKRWSIHCPKRSWWSECRSSASSPISCFSSILRPK